MVVTSHHTEQQTSHPFIHPPTRRAVPVLTSLSSLTASQAMTFSSSTIIPHLSPSLTSAVYPLACFFPFPFPFFIPSAPPPASFPYLCSFSALKNLIHLVCSFPHLVSPTFPPPSMTPGCSLLVPVPVYRLYFLLLLRLI